MSMPGTVESGSAHSDRDRSGERGFARVAGFVKIGDFEGSATAAGHEGWSPLVGLRLGAERVTGSFISSDKAVGSVSFDAIAVHKVIDGSSVKAFKACLDGRKLPKVQIHVTTTIAGKPCVTFECELEDVNVSAYGIGDAVGDAIDAALTPTDTVEFRFHKLTMTVNKFDATGASKGKVQESYTVGS